MLEPDPEIVTFSVAELLELVEFDCACSVELVSVPLLASDTDCSTILYDVVVGVIDALFWSLL